MKKDKVTVTFKVHKVNASLGEERVVLFQLDPHEHTDAELAASNDLNESAPNSGNARINLHITAPGALGHFRVGDIVDAVFQNKRQKTTKPAG